MNLSKLQLAVIKTISHFDVLDYPLTLLEICKFCELATTPLELLSELQSETLTRVIGQQDGLYYLVGRDAILTTRHQRYLLALQKLRKARRAAVILNCFPWVRAVGIYSSLALKNSRASGDLDLFFITAANRAWSARFFLNLFLKIFGLRPTSGDTKNKLCASYWIDEHNCSLAIANLANDTCFGYFGPANLIFLSGRTAVINKFYHANSWNQEKLPNWQTPVDVNIKNQPLTSVQNIIERIFEIIKEKDLRTWQKNILPNKYHENNDGRRVILGNHIIKLHDNDKREKFNQLFEANYRRSLTVYDQTT